MPSVSEEYERAERVTQNIADVIGMKRVALECADLDEVLDVVQAHLAAASAPEFSRAKAAIKDELGWGEASQELEELADRMEVRLREDLPNMRVAVAAKLLELTPPTVHRWAEAGILEEVEDSSPKKVTTRSVLEVQPHIHALRELGKKRNLLEAVLARIEDRELIDELRQEGSLKYKRSELTDITPPD